MRIGSLVYATAQGLGILAKSFFDAGVVTDAMVIRHGTHRTYEDWYPKGTPVVGSVRGLHQSNDFHKFVESVDLMLFFETPFDWHVVDYCRSRGVKTVLMPMYECTPERLPAIPDAFFCPSHLDMDYFCDGMCGPAFIPRGSKYGTATCYYTPVPVDGVSWRQRTKAEVFVHNAGHGGLKGRNGTAELVEAWLHVESGAKLVVRSQEDMFGTLNRRNVEFRVGTIPYDQLYTEGDVFVFPEKFNGLSLPLQEARASGMLVMCGDRRPMNAWLPTEPLITVAGYKRNRIGPPYMEFDEAIFRPKAIAAKIDAWYGRDILQYSFEGRLWAECMSWKHLKPQYMEVLEHVRAGN